MTPGVRSFVLGFVVGAFACMWFVTYHGDLGGKWLIGMGQKMKRAAETKVGDMSQARQRF